MPDWIAHVLVAWSLCTILGFKFKQFDTPNTVIAMIGSLIPDIFKIIIPLQYLGIYIGNFIYPIHLPVGSLIITVVISLFFKERKIIFLFLLFGFLTHYVLDFFLINLIGGMPLFFPLSWEQFEWGIIPADDYNFTLIIIVVALIVYFIKLNYIKFKKQDNNI